MKKTISLLLTAMMLLSAIMLAPITASADSKTISSVTITDIVEPVIGNNPVKTCTVSEGVTVSSVSFEEVESGDTLKTSKTFRSGYTYYVAIQLIADDGYKVNTANGDIAVSATVNGKEATVGSYYLSTVDNKERFTVILWFDKLLDPSQLTYLSKVQLYNNKPVPGEKPVFAASSGTGYSVTSAKWVDIDADVYMKASDTFVEGKQYKFTGIVKPEEGFAFSTIDGNPDVAATINGEAATTNTVYGYTADKCISVSATYTCEYPYTVLPKFIEITHFSAPEAGYAAEFSFKYEDGYTLEFDSLWNDTDSKDMQLGEKFETGKSYELWFYLKARDGYRLPVDDQGKSTLQVSTNGIYTSVFNVTGKDSSKVVSCRVQYNALPKTGISHIFITGFRVPRIGETPSFSIDEDDTFSVVEYSYFNGSVKMIWNDKFKEGNNYSVSFKVKAKDDFRFSVDESGASKLSATVDGNKAENYSPLNTDNVNYAYFTYDFTPAPYQAPTEPETTMATEPETTMATEPETTMATEPETTMATEPETTAPVTEPETTMATEPETTAPATEPATTPATESTEPTESKEPVCYAYLPSAEQEKAGYNYSVLVQDENGALSRYDMIPSSNTIGGVVVYIAEIPADVKVTQVYFRVYEGDIFVDQVAAPADAAEKVVKYDGTIVDYNSDPTPSSNISDFKITGIKTMTYTGKAITQKITVKDTANNYTLVNGTDYKVTYKNNTKVGTATMTITALGDYEGTIKKTFKIVKASNPVTFKSVTKSVKLKDIKKKTVTVKNSITVKNAQGTVSYKITSIPKSLKKLTKISSKGTFTIKKWTKAKKGTYKIKVKVTAKGNSNYNSKSKTVEVKIKIK